MERSEKEGIGCMSKIKFKCKKCGWCCRNTNVNISYSDVMRWKREKRYDILSAVSFMDFGKNDKRSGFYFIDTLKKRKDGTKKTCLYFRDTPPACKIYVTRPRSCRDFPLVKKDYGECPEMKRLLRGKI